MMADICSKAWRTLIWLGKAEEDSVLAVELIRKLSFIFHSSRLRLDEARLVVVHERSRTALYLDPVTIPYSLAWKALGKVLERPWFTT